MPQRWSSIAGLGRHAHSEDEHETGGKVSGSTGSTGPASPKLATRAEAGSRGSTGSTGSTGSRGSEPRAFQPRGTPHSRPGAGRRFRDFLESDPGHDVHEAA